MIDQIQNSIIYDAYKSATEQSQKTSFPKEEILAQLAKNAAQTAGAGGAKTTWESFLESLDASSKGDKIPNADEMLYLTKKYDVDNMDYDTTLDFIAELNQIGVLTKGEAESLFVGYKFLESDESNELALDDDLKIRMEEMEKAMDDLDNGLFFGNLSNSINMESILTEQLKRNGTLEALLGDESLSNYEDKLKAISTLAQFSSSLMLF